VLPGVECVPRVVDDLLSEELVYLASDVPLHVLLDPEFLHGFVEAGISSFI